MSAELRRLFPEGLKETDCERFKLWQQPVISFFPKAPPFLTDEGAEEYNKTITIELDQKTTVKVTPYNFVCVESFLAYQAEHDYILSQQGGNN